jgi:hypothetical protein
VKYSHFPASLRILKNAIFSNNRVTKEGRHCLTPELGKLYSDVKLYYVGEIGQGMDKCSVSYADVG